MNLRSTMLLANIRRANERRREAWRDEAVENRYGLAWFAPEAVRRLDAAINEQHTAAAEHSRGEYAKAG